MTPQEFINRHRHVQNGFDDVRDKLNEIADVFRLNGFKTELLRQAIEAVYEARTHVERASDED